MKLADKEEFLKVLDENGNSVGIFEKRSIIHQNQLFHNEVVLWVIDKQRQQVLVQRRSKLKKQNPNKIALCAGHVVGDETIEEALKKEAFEEIGLNLDNFDIKHITTIKRTEINNYCFSHHYCILYRVPIENLKIQEEELSEVFYIDYEKLKKMIKNSDEEVAIFWSEDVKRLFEEIDKIVY